jgi:hypothetical protein
MIDIDEDQSKAWLHEPNRTHRSPRHRPERSAGRAGDGPGRHQPDGRYPRVSPQLPIRVGNPSLETLWRLATAFDIALGTLLGEHDPPAIQVIRAEDGASLTSESGFSARLVLAEGREHRTEIYEAHLHAGSEYVSLHPPGTEELVFCLEGALEVGPEGLEESSRSTTPSGSPET